MTLTQLKSGQLSDSDILVFHVSHVMYLTHVTLSYQLILTSDWLKAVKLSLHWLRLIAQEPYHLFHT